MNKRIIVGLMINVLAGLFFTSTINAAPAHRPDGYRKEILKDGMQHHDKYAQYHHRDIRYTRAELKRDKAIRNYHVRHGHKAAAAYKQHEIRKDKRHLHHERSHGKYGPHHGHRHHGHHNHHNHR